MQIKTKYSKLHIKFVAFDENNKLVVEHDGSVLDDSSTQEASLKLL